MEPMKLYDDALLKLAREYEDTLIDINAGTTIVCDLIGNDKKIQFMGCLLTIFDILELDKKQASRAFNYVMEMLAARRSNLAPA